MVGMDIDQIICDDFRNHLDKFEPGGFVISDPPYNQAYHYNEYKDNHDLADYRDLLSAAFSGRKSVIIHYPEETLNIIAPAMSGDWCEQSVAWVYNSNTAKQHRSVTWWNCSPDMTAVGQPYKNPQDKRIAARIADGKQSRLYDWWEIDQVKNVSKSFNTHPCPIPLRLAKRIILTTTKPGDLVIDPFVGSGTVCIAAKQLGRRYLGFDISQEYVDIAELQLKQEQLL